MRQPYIYTLPEQFLEDKSVPLRWKLYTLINGFWISGKEVFASNKFFALKLNCSERYIQDCLVELEKIGVVQRTGISQSRRIVPGGRTQSSWGDEPRAVQGDEPRAHHISDSNSDSLLIVSDEEKNTKTPYKRKHHGMSQLLLKAFEVVDPKNKTYKINATQLQACDFLIEEYGYEKVLAVVEVLPKINIQNLFVAQITSPHDLKENWVKLVNAVQKKNLISKPKWKVWN